MTVSLKLNRTMRPATRGLDGRDGSDRPAGYDQRGELTLDAYATGVDRLDGHNTVPLEASLLDRAERLDLSTSSRWPALRMIFLGTDTAALTLAGLMGGLMAGLDGGGAAGFAALLVTLWMAAGWLVGIYAGDDLRAWATGVPTTPRMLITALAVSWPAFGILSRFTSIDATTATLTTIVVGGLLSAAGRALARGYVHRKPSLRHQALIVGSGVIATTLVGKLRSQAQFGLDPVGFIDDDPHLSAEARVPHLGRLDDLSTVLQRHSIDRVIFAFSRAGHDELIRSIRASRDAHVAVDIVPRLFELLDGVPGLVNIGGLPLISLSVPRLDWSSRAAKRALDAVTSLGVLALLSPVLLAIALIIRLESPGPVFFHQRRVGRDGKRFEVLKFRSMFADAEHRKAELTALNDLDDGVMFKMHVDPRVTRSGRILRRYSLDELPQLINVLRGEMSLVGPRPLIEPEADALGEDWHARRLDLRPGLTGPWQVSGRSDTTVEEMVRFDYSYVAGWSLARDLELLLATVPAVLSGRGAY